MSVKVNRASSKNAPIFSLGPPKALMQVPFLVVQWANQYAVSKDGQRLYFLEPIEQPDYNIHIITQVGRGKTGYEGGQ